MATHLVNKRGVAKARKLIDAQQYRVRSRWADAQPRAAEWEHTEVMLAAHRLLVYLDKSRT